MESVFGSAYCIVAASCASGSSDGLVESRPERPCVLMQRAAGDGTYYVCKAIDDFHKNVGRSELNQRDWVL
jgi:hypothetical protein